MGWLLALQYFSIIPHSVAALRSLTLSLSVFPSSDFSRLLGKMRKASTATSRSLHEHTYNPHVAVVLPALWRHDRF